VRDHLLQLAEHPRELRVILTQLHQFRHRITSAALAADWIEKAEERLRAKVNRLVGCGSREPSRSEALKRRGRHKRLAQKKWGPALLPAPTAPSEGYAGVRNLVHLNPKAQPYPLSILAHQLRRRFPPHRSLRRGAL